jgi:hypothetical protein
MRDVLKIWQLICFFVAYESRTCLSIEIRLRAERAAESILTPSFKQREFSRETREIER